MIDFSISLDERRVTARFKELPEKLRAELRPVIAQLTEELLGRVRAMEPRRTGRLQRATQAFVDEKETFIRGRVRVVAPAGGRTDSHEAYAALEYGAHRVVHVSQHQTHVTHVFNRIASESIAVVDAYTRRANIREYGFLSGPMEQIREKAKEQIELAVQKALR